MRPVRAQHDDVRERRLAAIKDLVDRFLYELALLMAGHEAQFRGLVSAELFERLHAALLFGQSAAGVLRPDFGTFAAVRVMGDLLSVSEPVAVAVEFKDRSSYQHPDGRFHPMPRRNVLLDPVHHPEGQSSSRPSSRAVLAASKRLRVPSFPRIADTW